MKKILVVDDADFILESTSTLLRFEGYDVYTASDGLEGVDRAKEHKPDLILCDISMPGLDGYGVLDQIRADAETATTPFIFLTAFTEKQNMRTGMEKGADDFLVKPYTRDELIAAIEAQWKKVTNIDDVVTKKVEAVGRNMTYALPHEFRTVLNQVSGSAKYLNEKANEVSEDLIKELSSDIISSSERLLKITENFLIYVRIEAFASSPEKRKQLRTYKTDEPAAMLYDLSSMIALKYDRNSDVEVNGEGEDIYVEMSTESFHKIVDELFDNAMKFSEVGSKIDIRYWLDRGQFYMKIKDLGRGMSPEQVSNVGAYIQFERTIYEQQGVGLGLVIAKRLVELHDGKFIIDSKENEYTEITLSIPYVAI